MMKNTRQTPKYIRRVSEEEEQQAVFEWAKYAVGQYPDLEWMHHIPNGGYRTKAEAGRFKAAGVKSGVPDISFPVPRRGYHGMYIEMKALDGKTSDNQKKWLEALSRQGYFCRVCYGADDAICTITWYLGKEHG